MTEQSFFDGRVTLRTPTGTLSLTFSRGGRQIGPWTAIRDAKAAVHYRLDGSPQRLTLSGPSVGFGVDENQVTFGQANGHLRLDWTWTAIGDALECWLEVVNLSQTAIALDRLDVLRLEGPASLDLPGPAADWRAFQNGWQSWSPTGVRRVGDGPFPHPIDEEYRLKHLPHGEGLRSHWVTVIEAQGVAPLLLGFVTAAAQLAEIVIDANEELGHLTAACHTDGITLQPGEMLRSERLRVAIASDGWSALESWASRMGNLMNARLPEKTPSGWCTWYCYFGFNSAQDVYSNLNAIRRKHLPLDLIIIDDGYQAAIGDWLRLDTDRFNDMASPATTIRREGRIPGIWTAPFGLAADSHTFAQHPDWVVADNSTGDPILAWNHLARQEIYALDTTHPQVAEWLYATFHTMRWDWGYDAFKIDFLFAAALPGRRYNPQATRAQALRRGLEIIREAVGDDAFLLGCGMPLGPAVGLVDGMRIGPDVSATWEPLLEGDLSGPGARNALRNSLARAFTHRRLWVADPDCLLIRPRKAGSQLSLYEARTLATLITLSGGMLVNSDVIGELPPSRLSALRQTLPPTDQVAYPLDLFEGDLPEILVLPIQRPWGRWWLVGLTNWDDHTRPTTLEPEALGLPPGRYHVYDQWRASYVGQTDGPLTLPQHRPHETLLLLIKPVSERPNLLTSTFHLTGGAVEVTDVFWQKLGERRQKLVVHLDKRGENFGRLVFTVPEGWVVLDAQMNGRRRSVNIRGRQARLVDMGFTLRDRAWVLVDFARV